MNRIVVAHINTVLQELDDAGLTRLATTAQQATKQLCEASQAFKDVQHPEGYYRAYKDALHTKKTLKQQTKILTGQRKEAFQTLLNTFYGTPNHAINAKSLLRKSPKETLQHVTQTNPENATALSTSLYTALLLTNKESYNAEQRKQFNAALTAQRAHISKTTKHLTGYNVGKPQRTGATRLLTRIIQGDQSTLQSTIHAQLQFLKDLPEETSALNTLRSSFQDAINESRKNLLSHPATAILARTALILSVFSVLLFNVATHSAIAQHSPQRLDQPTKQEQTLKELFQTHNQNPLKVLSEESIANLFSPSHAEDLTKVLAKTTNNTFTTDAFIQHFSNSSQGRNIEPELLEALIQARDRNGVSVDPVSFHMKQVVTVHAANGDTVARHQDIKQTQEYPEPDTTLKKIIDATGTRTAKLVRGQHLSEESAVGLQAVAIQEQNRTHYGIAITWEYEETLTKNATQTLDTLPEDTTVVTIRLTRFYIPS
jgi:hypothetical protein